MGSTWSPDAGLGDLHTGSRHPLSAADPESYFNLHVVPPEYQPKAEETAGTCCSIAMLTPGGWGSFALVVCPHRNGEF